MSVENKQVRGDASVSRNVNAGGNARVQGNMHVGHNLRVDGAVEAQNIKAANKGLFLTEAQLKARYPQPEEGWFAGVGSSSPFVVYIARKDAVGRVDWYATNGIFSVDVDMDSYNQRIDELESQLESNNALIAELIEIIREGGGSADLVMITLETNNTPGNTMGSVSGGGLKQKGSVTVTATAESGYHFVEWQDAEGVQISTDATYTFEATESVTLKAVFAVSYYTVTVGTDQTTLGNIGKSDPRDTTNGYVYDEEVTVTATPSQIANPTAYFVRWEDTQGVAKSTRASYTFKVRDNATLKAVFAQVAAISTDIIGTGTGTIIVSIMRGETPVLDDTDVRIGDVITLTLTGTSNELSALEDGDDNDFIGEVTFDAATHTATYTFTYTGEESLDFEATFGGDAVIVSRTIKVQPNNANYGDVHIEVNSENVGTQKDVPEGTEVSLVATPKTGFIFDAENGWKKGTEIIDEESTIQIIVSNTTAGTYTAYFKHEGEPDFYFGAVNTPNVGEYAADYTGLSSMLTSGYLVDNNEATINGVTYGKTFIYLYDAEKVTPNRVRVIPVGYEQYASNFTGEEIFDTATFHIKNNVVINGTTYTAIELLNGNESEGSEMRAEITFTANNNS